MIRFCIIPLLVIAPCIIADTSHSQGVLSKNKAFPPREGVWHGDSPHLFLGGQAILFCGSHGTFSGHADPPESKGGVTTAQYGAIFEGELKLNPPLVRQSRSYSLNEPIRMVERIVSNGGRGRSQTYATELTAIVFNGSGLPRSISIRESPRRRSIGKASITPDSRGPYRIQSAYEVWLEISVDGGKSWRLADNAVTMSLMPDKKEAKPVTIRKRQLAPR